MRKFLAIYALVTTTAIALMVATIFSLSDERARLRENQSSLCAEVEHYRTRADKDAAAIQVLRLRCGEYEELREADAKRIKELGIRLRRLEASAKSITATALNVATPLRDTIFVRDTSSMVRDTLKIFRWQDPWVKIDGLIGRDSVRCNVESIDTLHQIVHRVPRRFLFFRYGTKALRQEIVSSNPHTRIVYTEYIKIERRRAK
jgi:hypothetical protein